jgi:hypothetical protein
LLHASEKRAGKRFQHDGHNPAAKRGTGGTQRIKEAKKHGEGMSFAVMQVMIERMC